MRITQSMISRNYLKNLNKNLSNIADSNEKLSSGRKFTKMSNNVSDGARALKVREQLYKNEQHLVNIRDAEAELSSAESNLKSVNEILQLAQEKVLSGMNGTSSGEKRKILAQEITNMQGQILQFTNAQFSDKYLFGGTNNATTPFTVDASGKLLFNGKAVDQIYKNATDGKFYINDPAPTLVPQNEDIYIDVGLGLQMNGSTIDPKTAFKTSFSGLDILGFGKDSNGVTNNIYNLMGDISKALSPTPPDVYDGNKLGELKTKLTKLTDELMVNITDLGTRSNFLEKTGERLDNDVDNLTELRSKLEAIDDKTETMNLKMYEYSWMVTLQIGSKILPQSLMDFLR